jgi:hypothetical protein
VREVRVMRVSSSKAPRLCTSTAGRQLQLVGRVGSLPLIFGKGHKQPSLAAPQTQGLCSSSQSPLSSGARLLRGSRFPGFLCRASKDDGPKRGSGPWNPFGWILQLGSAVQTHTAFRWVLMVIQACFHSETSTHQHIPGFRPQGLKQASRASRSQ